MSRGGAGGFGPTVLAGLVTAGLATAAATRPWYVVDTPASTLLPGADVGAGASATFPAASALSLVLLAAWGVLLVTRGPVRRGFAVVAALAAVVLVVATVVAWTDRPEDGVTTWYWVGLVAALAALVPAVLACLRVGRWPEMGRRYDAPTAGGAEEEAAGGGAADGAVDGAVDGTVDGAVERDLWRSLDEGRDPTVRREAPGDH